MTKLICHRCHQGMFCPRCERQETAMILLVVLSLVVGFAAGIFV